jgi:LPPG:FO 2-phospho-L-lactate transferase
VDNIAMPNREIHLQSSTMQVVALAGGVGGARLADGFMQAIPPEHLTVIVNVGDDFEHLGLRICPDLDTVCYTLAGVANPTAGWGRADETWQVLDGLAELGGPTWFRLGDRDLALHLERTARLRSGLPLSQITYDFCQKMGIPSQVLPVTDDAVPTMVLTRGGELPFQEYFVRQRCEPEVTGFHFAGVEHSHPAPRVLEALHRANLVVICPSNPWVSIDPILAVPGITQALENRRVVGVSPIIGGQTVKGPAAKMFTELGIQASAQAVAAHYETLLTGFVLDEQDTQQADAVQALDILPYVTDTIMRSRPERRRLALEILEFSKLL